MSVDVVRIDVPTFIRLLELSREDIAQDADIHDIAEKVIEISQRRVVTMSDYDRLVDFMHQQGKQASTKEIETIKRLGGL